MGGSQCSNQDVVHPVMAPNIAHETRRSRIRNRSKAESSERVAEGLDRWLYKRKEPRNESRDTRAKGETGRLEFKDTPHYQEVSEVSPSGPRTKHSTNTQPGRMIPLEETQTSCQRRVPWGASRPRCMAGTGLWTANTLVELPE